MKTHKMKSSPFKTLMKNNFFIILSILIFSSFSACKKKKVDDPIPQVPGNDEEVITTMKLLIKDSITGKTTAYFFKDPDGDGGQVPFYGPSASLQTDSVLQLDTNSTYFVYVLLMDETKSPVDTTSNEVQSEGKDHLFFYNNGSNTIINTGTHYAVKLAGSNMEISYLDIDAGTPQRVIGLSTRWRTQQAGKYPLNITLRHQPGVKDGSYAPGDSDISVNWKYQVNP